MRFIFVCIDIRYNSDRHKPTCLPKRTCNLCTFAALARLISEFCVFLKSNMIIVNSLQGKSSKLNETFPFVNTFSHPLLRTQITLMTFLVQRPPNILPAVVSQKISVVLISETTASAIITIAKASKVKKTRIQVWPLGLK